MNDSAPDAKPPLEVIAANNDRSLNTLSRAIQLSEGQFSLILARCNYGSLRAEIVQRLKQRCPVAVQELYLPASVTTLYSTIQAELGNQQPAALMVFGLEWVTAIDQVLTSTNQIREEFRKNYPFPLVLWVNDDILQKLIQLAPDFKSWAAASIKFDLASEALIANLKQMADAVFTAILNLGAGRLDNLSLNQALDARHSLELEFIAKELQNRCVTLPPDLQASLLFLRARAASVSDEGKARQLYEESLQYEPDTQLDFEAIAPDPTTATATSPTPLERQGCIRFYLGLWWRQQAVLHRPQYQAACLQAKDYYRQCVEGFLQGNRPELAARFINAWGEVLTRLEPHTAELETVAELAVELHQRYSEPIRLAYGYGLQAEVALHRADWMTAKQFAELALDTNEQPYVTDREWDRQYYHNLYLLLLAEAEQHLDQQAEAIAHLEVARTESEPQSDPLRYVRILEALRRLYFQRGEYRKAFQIKREQRSIEQQYGLRAFIGAGRLQPTRQVFNLSLALLDRPASVAQEIAVSIRQQDVNRLIQRITRSDRKLSVIYGQSGVGKSSLVRAGLVPALRQMTIEARDILPVLLDVYTDWDGALQRTLEDPLAIDSDPAQLRQATPELLQAAAASQSNPQIDTILEQLQQQVDRKQLIVIIFDQFEEFFFVYKDRHKRLLFYNFLSQCLNLPYVKVILSLREDYIHFLLEFNRFGQLDVIQNNILDREILYYLGNFLPTDAKLVIQGLTQRSQVYLEPTLIDQLVQDLASDSGEVRPIELQIVGSQLETEKITTLADYQQQGTKEKLVERFLEGVIQDCGKENEKTARLLLYLLTDENGTRPLKTRAELATDLASDSEKLDLILEILVESGLVFLLPEVPADRYQLVHDYLVLFIRQQQGLGLLAELEKLRQQEQLSQAEIEQLRKEKELLAELSEAKEKQKRSEDRLNRFLRWMLVGATIGLAALAYLAFNASNSDRTARAQRQKAIEERRQAVNSQIEALSSSSQLLLPTDQLKALFTSIKMGKALAGAEQVPDKIRRSAEGTLQQTVYAVQERNRLRRAQTDQVLAVSFSPDGQLLASAGQDKTIDIWTPAGARVKPLTGHQEFVTSVAFSPNSQLLASSSDDKTIKLWTKDGTLIKTFTGHREAVKSVSFSPDGQRLASGSLDGTVKLWTKDGKTLKTLDGPGQVHSVAFSPDGRFLAAGGSNGLIQIWKSNGDWWGTFGGHRGTVYSLSFSPDSKTIVSASQDRTLKFWNTDGQLIRPPIEAHDDEVRSVSFSPDGKTIASASNDRTIKLWSREGRLLRTLTGHGDSVYSVAFQPDGKMIASASRDKTVRLWGVSSAVRQNITGHEGDVWNVQFSPDGKTLASASMDKTIKLWNTDGTLLNTLRGHEAGVISVQFSPDGHLIASASNDNTVKLWNRQTGALLQTLKGHQNEVYSVNFSPDGQQLVSSGLDGSVIRWSISGKLLRRFMVPSKTEPNNTVYRAVFSPDGKTIATASKDKLVKLWSLDGERLQTYSGHEDEVYSVAFSWDGERLVSASRDGKVRLWQIKTGKEQTPLLLEGHKYGVQNAVFSPDGKTIASASEDQTIKLWNAEDGALLATLSGHSNTVYSVSFSPDGKTLASASKDETIRLWDTETLDFQGLLDRGCSFLRDYLHNAIDELEDSDDQRICD